MCVCAGINGKIRVTLGGGVKAHTTSVYSEGKSNLALEFEEEVWLPVWLPTPSKRLALSLVHKEFGRSDLLVATAYIELDSVTVFEENPVKGAGGLLSLLSETKYQGE